MALCQTLIGGPSKFLVSDFEVREDHRDGPCRAMAMETDAIMAIT